MPRERIVIRWICFSASILLAASGAGQSVFDSPTQKLDDLLLSWQGRTVERLQEVWGHEQSIELRRGNTVYVYEKRIKVRAGVFGVAVYPKGGLRCIVRFEVNDKHEIVRTSRQGGGQECWSQFRKYGPD